MTSNNFGVYSVDREKQKVYHSFWKKRSDAMKAVEMMNKSTAGLIYSTICYYFPVWFDEYI